MAGISKWTAKWIWLDYTTPWAEGGGYRADKIVGIRENEKNRWGLFRKRFDLPADFDPQAESGKVFISVDSRYKLFVNGQYVGRGIYRCNRYNWYYDEHEVSGFLQPGENVLCVIAQFFGEDMSWFEPFPHGKLHEHSMGKGALIFELVVGTSAGLQRVVSDKTTRAHPCEAWDQKAARGNIGLPFVEIFDAKKWPEGWFEVNFDDSDDHAWEHARELDVGDLWPNLILCDIPRLSEERLPAACLVSAGEIASYFDQEDIRDSREPGEVPIDFLMQLGLSGYKEEYPDLVAGWDGKTDIPLELNGNPVGLVFDMGKDVSGFIYFELDADMDDATMDIAWGEKLSDAKDHKFPHMNPYTSKYGMQYHCRAGRNAYELFHWYGFRYIQVNISGSPGNACVRAVGTNLYLYPVENSGTFNCSDPRLSAVYDACRWTLRNCMHDGYEDCPSREQRQWIGDAYVEAMVNYALFGDTALVKKLIRQVAQSQRGDGLTEMATPGDSHVHGLIIPDYCFYWMSIVYQFYWYTGDRAVIAEVMPSMLKAINWFRGYIDPRTGLLTDLPYWIFIDWSTNDKWGANCALNAQFYHVLRQVWEMGREICWDAAVADLESVASGIANGINTYLWDEGRGAFVDAVIIGEDGAIEKKSHKVTFHANSLPILYEIAPPDRVEQILQNVFDQPYANQFVQHRLPLWKDITAFPYDEDAHVVVAEPFFMHHVNQTFAKLGRYDLIRRYLQDGWKKMLDHDATTIWETWDDGGSLCHAWCTTPAYDLATHCLGVQIAAPGAEHVVVAPHPMGLAWAEGAVPTMKGVVQVRWEWDERTRQFLVQWAASQGMSIECRPPEMGGVFPSETEEMKASGGWAKKIQYTY